MVIVDTIQAVFDIRLDLFVILNKLLHAKIANVFWNFLDSSLRLRSRIFEDVQILNFLERSHVGLSLNRADALIGLYFIIIFRLVLYISLLSIVIDDLVLFIPVDFIFFTVKLIFLLMLVNNRSHFHVGHHIILEIYFVILINDTLFLYFLLVRQTLRHDHLRLRGIAISRLLYLLSVESVKRLWLYGFGAWLMLGRQSFKRVIRCFHCSCGKLSLIRMLSHTSHLLLSLGLICIRFDLVVLLFRYAL